MPAEVPLSVSPKGLPWTSLQAMHTGSLSLSYSIHFGAVSSPALNGFISLGVAVRDVIGRNDLNLAINHVCEPGWACNHLSDAMMQSSTDASCAHNGVGNPPTSPSKPFQHSPTLPHTLPSQVWSLLRPAAHAAGPPLLHSNPGLGNPGRPAHPEPDLGNSQQQPLPLHQLHLRLLAKTWLRKQPIPSQRPFLRCLTVTHNWSVLHLRLCEGTD